MTAQSTDLVSQAMIPIGGGLALAEFETQLESVLDVAYRTAYHLTRNSADAEDVVQEAALNACRHRASFQAGTNFKAWFLRIVTNAFYSRCRKASSVRESISLDDTTEPRAVAMAALADLSPGADPSVAFMDRLDMDAISGAIAELPLEFRVVTALYLVDDMAYQEIARVLEIPVGTVRSRLHRGRRLLQQRLWQIAVERGLIPHPH
ncbi:MAG: sigma-70 family RNA polymerase sigma factor [Gemmatimonadota bacterium]